jgi:hypothetical protein
VVIDVQQFEAAMKGYAEAVEIFDRFAAENPGDFRSDILSIVLCRRIGGDTYAVTSSYFFMQRRQLPLPDRCGDY